MDWQHKNIANRYRAGDRKILLFFIVLLTGSTPFCHSPYICSMSRKGNCYDNAPIESFWGKLKQEWLYHQRFKTRAQARDAVFEYIVDKAVEYKLGARGLRSIVETIMMDAMFEIPSEQKDNFVVTLDYAKRQLEKANIARLQSA